jgi:hypothetical protein
VIAAAADDAANRLPRRNLFVGVQDLYRFRGTSNPTLQELNQRHLFLMPVLYPALHNHMNHYPDQFKR